jgi:hypothetical protein
MSAWIADVLFSSFLDALVEGCAAFEFKTVESLAPRHRSQLLHYLFMIDLPHGKLVNLRTERVQHEFVNATLRLQDRTRFEVNVEGWEDIGDKPIRDWFTSFARDIGIGLDNTLYEEALTILLGGEEQVTREIEVVSRGMNLGLQSFRLVAPDVALKITALSFPEPFEIHARRLIEHTNLKVIQWVNITRKELSFRTIRR